MSANFASIRDGLKTRLETISGLRASDVLVQQIHPPHAIIAGPEPNYLQAMKSSKTRCRFRIRLYVGMTSERTAQDKLDGYLAPSGSGSVRAAIEGDGTLGGTADYAVVESVTGYGAYTVSGTDYLGCDILVDVCA